MNRILLFARDPGGANTLIPLAEPLRGKGCHIALWGKGPALHIFRTNGLCANDIDAAVPDFSVQSLREFLIGISPRVILTGTSANDFTEKHLWKAAAQLSIPSLAIVDQWLNYGVRFSKYTMADMHRYQGGRVYDFLPSRILVMDERSRREAIKEELPAERLIVTGQPHFERILKLKKGLIETERDAHRDKLGIRPDDFTLLFVSEPIEEVYGLTGSEHSPLGYTAKSILAALLQEVQHLQKRCTRPLKILIRLHPNENPDKHDGVLTKDDSQLPVAIDTTPHPTYALLAADLVCGMSSMLLLEAVIMKIPVLSIQIGLRRTNPFILDRLSPRSAITTHRALARVLAKTLFGKHTQYTNFDCIQTPVANVIDAMEGMI
jgi:hypothetical protein